MTVRLVDMRVWSHRNLSGHTVYVRGLYPHRVFRCARHDCDWSFVEDHAKTENKR